MLTKDTVKDHCSPQSYSILKYFLDPLSRLKEEEFREIVHRKHNIAAEELNQQNEEKVNRAIDEGYKKYLDMCKLADEDGINFYITNNDTQSPFYNKHSEEAYIGKWHRHNKQVNCSINEIEGIIQFLRNENLHEYDINIPSFGINLSSGDYYSQDMRDIVINNNSQLTGQISCSNSVAAKELINRNTNINQYGLLYGNNPIILAISKGWNHIDPDSSREPSHDKFPQMEIINKLMEYQDLDINVIDLKTGMTPLHIACLRGDSLELIIKLLEKEADPEAEDYLGKKPADLLNYKYQEVQKVIGSMTGRIFGVAVGGTNYEENQSFCATLPTRRERDENVKRIREVLHCNHSTFNKEIFNSDSRELENKINQYNAKTLRDRGRESGYSSEEDSWNKMLTTLFKQKDQSSSNSNVPQGPEIEQPKLEPLAGQVHYVPDIEKSQKLIVEEAPSPAVIRSELNAQPEVEPVKEEIVQPQQGLIVEEVNQAEEIQLEPEIKQPQQVPVVEEVQPGPGVQEHTEEKVQLEPVVEQSQPGLMEEELHKEQDPQESIARKVPNHTVIHKFDSKPDEQEILDDFTFLDEADEETDTENKAQNASGQPKQNPLVEEENLSPTVFASEGDPQPKEEPIMANLPVSDTTNGETPTTEHVEQPQPKAPIHNPVAPSDDTHVANEGVDKNSGQSLSNPQEKPKNNSKYYYIGIGAVVGLAVGLGIAFAVTSTSAWVFIIAAAVVGALLGAGIGYGISKCLDRPDVQPMSDQAEKLLV